MSESYHYTAGVLKFDYTAAGFPDLQKIAQEWAKDPRFYHIMVRWVSEKNLGIHFLFVKKHDTENSKAGYKEFNEKYYQPLEERFGKGMYAIDLDSKAFNDTSELQNRIIVHKTIDFDNLTD